MKGIIFTENIDLIMTGKKTQTRRIINPQPTHHYDDNCPAPGWFDTGGNRWACKKCGGEVAPFTGDSEVRAKYISGEVVYVKEAYCPNYFDDHSTAYKADYNKERIGDVVPEPKWRNPMYMPQSGARIFLRITIVRAERLQEISGKDAYHEGINPHWWNGETVRWANEQRAAFRKLWDKLHAKDGNGWDVNPWVWVYEFERITANLLPANQQVLQDAAQPVLMPAT